MGRGPRILIACEVSGRVRNAFRKLGFNAWSCDLEPNPSPYHFQCDVRELLFDYDYQWDMMICFPPCTYLSNCGNAWRNLPGREEKRNAAIQFAYDLYYNSGIPRIAMENPKGSLSTCLRKPDQIIQPYQFGDPYTKTTCLWLKNLPLLSATNIVEPIARWVGGGSSARLKESVNWRKGRSVTFQGIANAMAEQWSECL